MPIAIQNESRAPQPAETREVDARLSAFCSPDWPDPFHGVSYASQVWQADPSDVEAIHQEARARLRTMVARAAQGGATGRILLMLGEAGTGKTHLLRAFRNELHAGNRGYVGYMQMTAFRDDPSRYVLANLIESLDRPYDEGRSHDSGLTRLSQALARSAGTDAFDRLREAGTDAFEVVRELADRIAMNPRFATIDYDLVQAILLLQAAGARVKAILLRYLRCEDLSPRDREDLGGIVPRVYASASQWMLQRLGELIGAVEGVPLVICVDQLEDMFDEAEAPAQFRRVLATLCDLTSRLPTSVVVISCLEDFFDEVKQHLTQPITRRVTPAPGPVELPSACDREQVVALIGRRLAMLDRSAGIAPVEADPTYPIPDELIRRLIGLGARDVLDEVRRYREACIAAGRLVSPSSIDRAGVASEAAHELDRQIAAIEQAWDEARSGSQVVPTDETELAAILADAIGLCEAEMGERVHIEAGASGRFVEVERQETVNGDMDAIDRRLVAICNKAAQGGALTRQISELIGRADGLPSVVLRSSAFPASAKSPVTGQLASLAEQRGGHAVVEDSEWRAMMAMGRFRAEHDNDPTFDAWLIRTRPLTGLSAIRAALGLD